LPPDDGDHNPKDEVLEEEKEGKAKARRAVLKKNVRRKSLRTELSLEFVPVFTNV
jgi:hypothetical protein